MKLFNYTALCFLLALVPACLAGAGGDEEPLPLPAEEEMSVDGSYSRVDAGRQDVLEVFEWLKEELIPRGLHLRGEKPLGARIQVVAGYKYILLCNYIDEETGMEKRLAARVYRRSDGVTELQDLELAVE